jgi:hypothetical protein
MKKVRAVFGLIVMLAVGSTLLVAQAPQASQAPQAQTFLLARYSNNHGPGAGADQFMRLVNVGVNGTPMTSLGQGPGGVPGQGDVCANIYVFDSSQAMMACCACRLTPNELLSASVGNQLTNNSLTRAVPAAGVIKILLLPAGPDGCTPIAPFASSDATLVTGFGTHLETTGSAMFVTETPIPVALLGAEEANFLSSTCLFVRYLGSGRGICGCSTPGQ